MNSLENAFINLNARSLLTDGSHPLLAHQPESVWLVVKGQVDLFTVEVQDQKPVGALNHLTRVPTGGLIFGIETLSEQDLTLGLLLKGNPETTLLEVEVDSLFKTIQDEEESSLLSSKIKEWVNTCISGLGDKDAQIALYKQHVQPIDNELIKKDTDSKNLKCCLLEFHQDLMVKLIAHRIQAGNAERQRYIRRHTTNQRFVDHGLTKMAEILSPDFVKATTTGSLEDPLLTVCQKVGNTLGINIVPPHTANQENKEKTLQSDALLEIARASRVRTRNVVLKGEWWRGDCGPLVARLEDSHTPVAILPKAPGRYELFDPTHSVRKDIDQSVAATIEPVATMLYRPFPDKSISGKELIHFGMDGLKKDLFMVVLMGMAGGLLGILTPMATGLLFDSVIPGAEKEQLYQIIIGLFVAAFAGALFQVTRGIAIQRISGKMDISLQCAMWDRLLELPTSFFRKYTSGELAERAMGINAIRQIITGTVTTSILGGIFGIFNMALLFHYSVKLALFAVLLVVIGILITFWVARKQMLYLREITAAQQKISGMVLQFISGIAKLRITGTESRAFGLWAEAFSNMRQTAFRQGRVENYLTIFNSAFPHLATMTIFSIYAYWLTHADSLLRDSISTGSFLAFNSAFGIFLSSGIQMSKGVISILSIIPHYENTKVILETLPEVDATKMHAGNLSGNIELSHVFFRYDPDGPLILSDVSATIQPGQFVAVVGGSGSGKSTMLRLLLGFEKPESGSIFYDGQDLATLDIRSVRRQSGVVLQNAQLMAGDIFTNIVGASSQLTIDNAWQAAQAVGLKEDIEVLPMGMHTVLSEGGGGLSGGQRQRMVIARAIVHKPKILFFDEATSALDNKTQATVTQSLEQLNATRIVIAHRLSTIKNADLILVMEKGKLVESGTYRELMEQNGIFTALAKRQIS